jgi:Ni,Fe-hydrogenase III large subunit
LAAFVAPGREVALAKQIDLEAAGLRLVANPRHADVLVLAGEIPPGLANAVALTYAEMPRPRAILSVGAGPVTQLPSADVTVAAIQVEVDAGVARLSALFRESAWTSHQPTVGDHAMGSMGQGSTGHDMRRMDHAEMSHREGAHDMGGHHDMGQMDLGQMDMGQMDMGGGGFMSMVMMTKDLPRSADGLPMDWLEVPFGPLFPGLPGGLGLRLTLDGDTVVRANVQLGALGRELEAMWLGPVDGFVDRFAAIDPLSPIAYRVLAEQALDAASGTPPNARLRHDRVDMLERERAANHLNWLASFAFLLGDRWLETAALALHRHLDRARDASALRQVREEARVLVRRVARSAFLARRLDGIGRLDAAGLAGFDGPVARAAGRHRDLHSDALSRLHVRLAELEQSLDLLLAAGNESTLVEVHAAAESGTGEATVETPRGPATLSIEIANGQIVRAHLLSPSPRLVELIPAVAEGHELAEALLGVASLDISPWEIDR